MKIGIIDVDTTHPGAWIPIERQLGHEIAGVWDGGSVHPPAYVKQFAAEHGIPRVFDSLAAMAAEVDCAVIHGCDWDSHAEKGRPFLEAGRAVLIDKPVAGNPADLDILGGWARRGARLAGGSSLRHCVEVQEWLALPVATRGAPHTVFAACGVDEFGYGIHAYSLLSGILGPGISQVRHVASGPAERIEVSWGDGRTGFVSIGTQGGWQPFHATVMTDKTVAPITPDPKRLYRALLDVCLPYLSGEKAEPPLGAEAWLEPERAAVAAWESRRQGGRPIRLADLAGPEGPSGSEYAVRYRAAKYGR